MNRRLVLEAPERQADGAGGFATTWAERGVLWGALRHRAGQERPGPAGAMARNPMVILVRAAPVGAPERPEPGQRLREGTRLYAVLAVTEADAGGRVLNITAEEEIAR